MNTIPTWRLCDHGPSWIRQLLPSVATLLATVAVGAPLGDSAIGTGTALGQGLNSSASATASRDKDWLAAKHTPTGDQYDIPFAPPIVRKTANGWEYSGQLEFGYIGGDAHEQNARYRMYQDVDQGAYLNNFSLQMRKPEGGYNLELTGGAAGRHDQYYGLQFGRYNAWNVKLFYSEIPHVFTHRFKSLWNGIGTGDLTLVPGLTPGGTASVSADNANIATLAADHPSTLMLTRKKSGARVDVNLTNTWKAYVSYSLEKRKGARPLGAVWGNSGGTAAMEIAEPIDYDTQDIFAGLQHVSGLNAFNLRFTASLFQNNLDAVTFQEPYRIAPAQGVTTVPAAGAYTEGQFALTPSNDAYNVRAEYTRSMPDFYRGSLTAVVSGGTWRQDENLLPYMITPNVTHANVTLLPGGSWDSTTALSRRTADAAIDTRLAHLTLSLNPSDSLNVKGKFRFHETENTTNPFLSVNPNAVYLDADAATAGNQSRGLTLDGVTGVWGRPLNDGSGQSILLGTNSTPAGNIPLTSLPYSSKKYTFGGTSDYRLSKGVSLNGALERETTRRTHRDRDRTWEDKLKVGLVNRALGDATLRTSYEFARRRGDEYRPSAYGEGFSPMLFAVPTAAGTNVTSWVRANSGVRTLDLADRDQHVVNGRLDTMLRPNLDAGVSVQLRETNYPQSAYGQTAQDQGSANIDLNYQPSPRQTLYGYYSYQRGKTRQASIAQANGTVVIGQPSPFGVITPANAVEIGSAPGGPLYPLSNEWTVISSDRNHVIGVGLNQEIGKASLNVDYSYSMGNTRILYGYTVGGAINAANAAFAGNRMPDLAIDFNYLDASLRYPLSDRLSARLVYRFQKESIRDWHYRNLEATPVVLGAQGAAALPTAVVLDGGPDDYNVKWFGIMFQLKL